MVLFAFLLICNLAAASLTITIPPSTILPNPNSLSASTHATLTTLSSGSDHIIKAPLSRSSALKFPDLIPGHAESYLLDIRSSEYIFAPYRVDVAADGSVLGVWETFRGNTWDNRGPEKYVIDVAAGQKQSDVVVGAKVLGRRGFYEERAKFSVLSLFKNPMILMAVVALGFTFGMPYLMENLDPELKAEFEQHSRTSTVGSAQNALTGNGFDLAGWMAGSTSSPTAKVEEAPGGTTGRDITASARKRG
ncbi:hypothetical protein N7495_000696 [Penicillium taxi]|uniref:uncharacterized protein n=1 Tax=Penicillium taxi TaxID=168475 RepID=UPI0025458F07|nr:uncharacterized protein N7495_000696 [Penicillium taxi]KAJ5908014.1 hypothetical protein N7495_000696 [Penicillium taxi]